MGMQFVHEVKQDARHSLRLWARHPWHTGFAIVALAIGIGANTGVFSVVNALLLRSLPFQDPGRLAALRAFREPHGSAAEFHAWRRQSTYLADVALVESGDVNLGGPRESRRAHLSFTSWNFFSLFGTQPLIGRAFAAGEDGPGRDAVAVIGYGLWQQLFGGDRRALGATIRADGIPLTVVGVAPPGFDFPENTVLWRPGNFSPGNNGWAAIARLKPGITWPQARAAFVAEAERLWPNRRNIDRIRYPPTMTPLREELAGPVKKASLILMAGVVLILMIACANVANLLIARTADRAGELSIRSALGASRARLSRQLLTECMLLSLAASLAGLAVAFWATSIAASLLPAPLASQAYSVLDSRVLGFAVGAAVLCGLLFGVLPSLFAGRVQTIEGRGSTGSRGSRLIRELLAAGQIMLTVILLAASVSVGRAFVKLMRIDRGFNVNGLVTVNVSLEGTTHQQGGSRLAYFEEALARVRRLPGVRSASATEFLPLYATMFMGGPFGMDGRPASQNSMVVPILPDYFRTMGGRLLGGREFTDAEVQADARLVVVNDRFAAEFGSPTDVLGHQGTIGNAPTRKIVGVVQGMDYMADANALQIFIPAHAPGGFFSTFVVRVDGRAEDRVAVVRDTIQSVDRQVPLFGAKSMEQRLSDALARPRFYSTAVIFFGAFAVLLAVIGIYGIVSYTVGRRTREMGVRMALGATPAGLRTVLLRQGLVTIAAGTIPGIAGAVLCGRLLENLVDGAKSVNAATCTASVVFIALVAAAGIWTATRPISRIEIMDVLRAD